MMSQMNQLRIQQVENAMSTIAALSAIRSHFDSRFDQQQRNINRMNPLYRKRSAAEQDRHPAFDELGNFNAAPLQRPARLAKRIRSLNLLWDEWLVGLDGHKPAMDFTSSERGKVKFVYSKRLHVWKCVSRHVNAGHTAEIAIDRIYSCFGASLSVTKVIQAFQAALKFYGPLGHPNLRV